MAFAPPARHLLRARDLADARYFEALTVEDLARAAGLSRAHFSREFRRAFGETPHAYLLTRRLERAAGLLRGTDRSIADRRDVAIQRSVQVRLRTCRRTCEKIAAMVSGASFTRGLHEVGDGLFAYLQPDGGWGQSNAGLVSDGERTLLIDTLFDLRLTERMLADMRRAVPAAARIDTLVNTHANGDHCYGNQLVGGARIVASERTAAEMSELPPAAMAALVAQAPQMGALGEFFLRCFGSFEFEGIEPRLPEDTFSGELALQVGAREVRLLEVGPAHTRGDTLAWLPAERVLYSGDILFNGGHPVAWAGPLSNWIAACERILALDPETIVPGHGPLATTADVSELKAYFEYLYERSRECHAAGMTPLEAARSLSLDRWADWGERERLVVNVASVYAELEPDGEPLDPLAAFQAMAEMAQV